MTGKSSAAPWSVKGVERSTRETARNAAQAAGMTVGAWIEQAIRSHETVLAAALPTPQAQEITDVMAAAQRAEVRSLEAGVARIENRSGDMVIPVALKVQELAHRLVEIEQARVAGRTRPPEPPAEPPLSLDDDFERFRMPEPEPEPAPADDDFERFRVPEEDAEAPKTQAQPADDEFPTPVPPPDDDFERFKVPEEPEPEPLTFGAETAIPEERPHRRSWARARERKPARRSRFRQAIGAVAGAILALSLGAGSAVLVLDHGELIGLPPRLVDPVAEGVDRALVEGRRLVIAADETARHWFDDLKSLFEDAPADPEKPAELPTASAPTTPAPEPPKPDAASAPAMPPASAVPPPTPIAPMAGSTATAPTPATLPPTPGTSPTPAVPSPPATPPQAALSTSQQPASPPPAPPQTAAVPPTVPPTPAPSSTATPPAVTPLPTDSAQGFPTLTQPTEAPPSVREASDLEKVARSGDVKAQYELGVMAAQPETGNPDYGKAAYWFREAAVQGNASAQYNLGVLYEHGLGVGADDVRALLWYHSAAEQGHARAQYNLGVFYAQGRGIPTDYVEAQRWFKRAADQGIAKAFYNLAVLSEQGLGGPANPSGARAFLSRAALLGDPEARAALARKPAPKPDPTKAADAKASNEVIGAVQHMLTELGYDAGRIDGMLGDKTRQAIRKFQSDNGLPQNGLASEELLELLTAKLGPSLAPTASARPQR